MQLTLRARILAAFLPALVAFGGALGYGLVEVRGIGEELSRVQEVWTPLSQQVTALEYQKPNLRRAGLEADLLRLRPDARRVKVRSLLVQVGHFKDLVGQIQRTASAAIPKTHTDSQHVRRVVERVGALSAPTQACLDALGSLETTVGSANADADAIGRRLDEIDFDDRRLAAAIKLASSGIDDGLRADANAAEAKSRSSLYALAALTAVATAFGIAAILLVGRALAPIKDLIAGAKRISAGDFSRRVATQGGGEVALLAGEFNQMAESLRSRDARLSALSAYNENVLESVRVGIVVADEAAAIRGMNRAAEEIWGVARADVVGRAIGEIAELAPFLDAIERVRSGGPSVRTGARALPTGREVEVSAVPFVEEGRQRGVVVLVEDVTDRAEVERRLLRSERLAAIGRMSSQITHEVRNPLNSMSLNVEMLEDEIGLVDGEARTLLTAIGREIERLTEITEGYLSFARLPKPKLERAPINQVVDRLADFVREEADKAGVALDVRLADASPEVLADENQLRQALLNVVRNALQAMKEKKGGHLRVETRADGDSVEVTVTDDGPGIEPSVLARIFDPFFSTKGEGTGLGLPLTQQIIEEHGGSIACASERGRGTTFTIRLPAAVRPEPLRGDA